MSHRDIILIGASAGGVQTLAELVRHLPRDLPATVFVVIHIAPFGASSMPAILSRSGRLPALHPKDGDPIEPGRIYVAPPDHHLVIEPERVRISRGPSENGHRPAVDVLFRTGAQVYGPRVIAVVLTGNLDDGTAGLAVVKTASGDGGGPGSHRGRLSRHAARAPSHPSPSITSCRSPRSPPSSWTWSAQPLHHAEPPVKENAMGIKEKLEQGEDPEGKGVPSALTCPECGGSLFEREETGLVHFRCRTGHAYSPESLLAKQTEMLESSLWAALRALEENAALARRMARRMRADRRHSLAYESRYAKRAEEAERHADVLRKVLMEEPRTLMEEPSEVEG